MVTGTSAIMEGAIVEGDVANIVARNFFGANSPAGGGVIVEVGAASPDFLSISGYFRSLGWRVVAVEPNPEFCKLHAERGHEVLQYACGDHDEDNVDFQVVNLHGADYLGGKVSFESCSSLKIKDEFSRIMPANAEISTIQVKLRRLSRILAEHAADLGQIDVLSIDVEGWELEVLAGLDFTKHRPRVMIIENLNKSEEYRRYCKSLGYLFWKRIKPNDIYLCASPGERLRRIVPRLKAMFGGWG